MTEQLPAPDQTPPPPTCPKCQGAMWDNRVGKRNPKAPDFKCKNRECDGVIWPPRDAVRAATPIVDQPAATGGMPVCPICGGPMWDDRLSKRNPKAPDFKCKNKPKMKGGPGCEGVIWPPRDGGKSPYPAPTPRPAPSQQMSAPPLNDAPPHNDDD